MRDARCEMRDKDISTKYQVPSTKNQESRIKNQDQDQEPRTKNQEPRVKNQEPRPRPRIKNQESSFKTLKESNFSIALSFNKHLTENTEFAEKSVD